MKIDDQIQRLYRFGGTANIERPIRLGRGGFWCVDLPGQPPSGNHMYDRIRGGGLRKKPRVEAYQAEVTLRVREARPSGWNPGPNTQLLIRFWYLLGRDIDCTNAQKVIEDAIALALRPEDKTYDRLFIPQTWAKATGNRQPRVVVGIEEW